MIDTGMETRAGTGNGYGYGYENLYPSQTRTREAGMRELLAVWHRSLKPMLVGHMRAHGNRLKFLLPTTTSTFSNPTSPAAVNDNDLQTTSFSKAVDYVVVG